MDIHILIMNIYSYPKFQIEKFSISVNLAKDFRLPKETMRRKIIRIRKVKYY
jgi:hypothetical protein